MLLFILRPTRIPALVGVFGRKDATLVDKLAHNAFVIRLKLLVCDDLLENLLKSGLFSVVVANYLFLWHLRSRLAHIPLFELVTRADLSGADPETQSLVSITPSAMVVTVIPGVFFCRYTILKVGLFLNLGFIILILRCASIPRNRVARERAIMAFMIP